MTGEVRNWFEQALRIPRANRMEFLDANCGDPAVRSEVASLLRYDLTESALDGVVKGVVSAVLGNGEPLAPAQRVGPFELGRLLGSGGMGAVYEAHRVDGEVRQRVAVKFSNLPALADRETREAAHRRFLRERQMLASLRHPYIAGLIDAGATEDGVPYAVIEQVDGVPIDRYCDASQLDDTARIRLALKLCEAVQFAHSNLIVHSDIKPDNVLITSDGIPKLIDFGVASDLGEDEESVTAMRAFTPSYASPEQSLGQPATVATDVYGIGAVLYRLITGVAPHQTASGPLSEVIRRISEGNVTQPSAIRRQLKGDLENILLKALHRDPERRYGSVPELRDDLNRYLERRPVRATAGSTVYRMSRFLQRHWAPMATAASLAVTLATATVVAVRQKEQGTRRAAESRRVAERLLVEVHDEIDGLVGGTKAREKLGAIAAQYLEGLERSSTRDPELAWELLNAYSRLGQSRGGAASSVGDTKSGTQLALKTLELGAVVEAASPDRQRLDRLFGLYEKLIPIFVEARLPKLQRETIDRLLRIAPRLQLLRQAQAWKELGRYFDTNDAPQESAEAFERALAIVRPLASEASNQPGASGQLVSTLVGLGRAKAQVGEFAAAVETLRQAIGLAESGAAADPHNANSARQLFWARIVLGDALASPLAESLGRTTEGVEEYNRARRIAEELVRGDAANEAAKLDLARALTREGLALAAIEPARAVDLLERAHSLNLKTDSECYPGLDCRVAYLAGSIAPLVRLGDIEMAKSRVAEARRLAQELGPGRGGANQKSLAAAEAILLTARQPGPVISAALSAR